MTKLLPLILLLCSGCCSVDVFPAAALRDAVQAEHMAYVQADPMLTPDQKARRQRTWDAFTAWIVEASK